MAFSVCRRRPGVMNGVWSHWAGSTLPRARAAGRDSFGGCKAAGRVLGMVASERARTVHTLLTFINTSPAQIFATAQSSGCFRLLYLCPAPFRVQFSTGVRTSSPFCTPSPPNPTHAGGLLPSACRDRPALTCFHGAARGLFSVGFCAFPPLFSAMLTTARFVARFLWMLSPL